MQQFLPYAALRDLASRQPDVEAIVIGGVKIAYGEFFERVTAAASWLLEHGLRPGEVTGICLQDEVLHLVYAIALLCLGTPHMSLGAHENAAAKRALARKTGVTQFVAANPEEWMEGLRTIVAPAHDPRAIATAASVRASSVFPALPLDAIGFYQNTSGSTNVPKTFGVSLARLLLVVNRYVADAKERRALRMGSIEYDAHRLHRICALLAGNTCIFSPDADLGDLAALCERAAVSIIHMGAYQLASLVEPRNHQCGRLPGYTGIFAGGSRVPGALRKKVKALLTDNLWVHYATSEAGTISLASPDQHEEFSEGVGFPAADVTVEIAGPSGDVLGAGEIGEIRVRKATMAKGYVSEPGATSNFRDGWFYPGDLLSLGEGGPLIFHGRADDVMNLNGINIFPTAIEDTLENHPDVREAIAYAVKSRIHGEIPVAAVVLSETARTQNTDHLLEHCRRSLGVRAPRQIRIVESIPRSAAGKRLRRELAGT